MHPRVTERRDALLAEARSLTDAAAGGALEGEALTRFEAITTEVEDLRRQSDQYTRLDAAIANGYVEGPKSTNVNTRTSGKPWEVRDASDLDEVRGRAVDTLTHYGVADDAIERALSVIDAQTETVERGNLARRIAICGDPAYTRAFMKLVKYPGTGQNSWTSDEAAAWQRSMSIGVSADGGYMVPTHLDPTIILTNAGSTNAVRSIARVVTLVQGNVWHGVSSAGVTASWDAENAEVSDDTPTLADPTVTAHRAQAFVPFSIEAGEDISSLGAELQRLFADAKENLEGAAFATGSGSGEPLGVFTQVAATSGSRIVSTTAAAIGLVDIHALYKAVPQRARKNAKWLMNPVYALAVRALGTSLSASFSGDLTASPEGNLLGKQIVESDDAPATQTTTTLDPEIMIGDFSNYVIADKPGSMQVELVPHMFNTANNRPDGRRGLYAHWRTGGAPVNVDAFRLLVDKTSA